jgi:predicted nucleic acid-binding protein
VNGYLVDTNILSELTKLSPAPQVEDCGSPKTAFSSVFSIGEIRKGIASLPAGARRAALEDWLNQEIMPWFGDRILPVSW